MHARTLLTAAALSLAVAAPASAKTTLKLHNHTVKATNIKNGVKVKQVTTDRKTGKTVGHVRLKLTFLSKHKVHFNVTVVLRDGTLKTSFDSSDPDAKVIRGDIRGTKGAYKGKTGTFKDTNTGERDDDLNVRLD